MDGTVLVTGGAGFLGRAVVDALLVQGAAVRVLDLPSAAVPSSWNGGVEVFRGDVADSSVVDTAAQGAAWIVHLAAIVGDAGSMADHRRVTVAGTERVCRAAASNGCRLLLVSSITVYGDRIGRQVCDEGTPFGRWQGPYSRAKQAQESLVAQFRAARGLDAVVVRPANIFGPRSGPWVRDAAKALHQGLPTLIGGGDLDAGLVFVDNVADLIVAALGLPQGTGTPLLAVDGYGVTWRQYFTDLARIVGAPPPRQAPAGLVEAAAPGVEALWRAARLPGRPPLTKESVNLVGHANRFDNSATRSLTGWQPRIRYEAGMAAVATAGVPASE